MQIGTVNAGNIQVSCGQKQVSGQIVPANAEYNYEKTAQYASEFVFMPGTGLSGKASVTIQNVKNYNGKALGQAYSAEVSVDSKPERIEIESTLELPYQAGTLLHVQVLPKEAGAGKSLTVDSFSPSIVSVGTKTVQTDKNGCASILLKGNLPGKSEVTVSMDGTGLAANTAVTVSPVNTESQAVSIENGHYGISLSQKAYTYDGTPKEPAVTVEGLEEKDYVVSYSGNINAGTAQANVLGVGNYVGVLTESFTIGKAVQNLTAELAAGQISVGEKAEVKASGIGNISYHSEDKSIAVIEEEGGAICVIGKKPGTTAIVVTAAGDQNHETAEKKLSITINTGTLAKTFTIAKASQTVKASISSKKIQAKATAKVTAHAIGALSFKSSNTKAAKIDSKGTVTGVAAGTAVITVTAAGNSNYQSASANITITVVKAPAAPKPLKKGKTFTSGSIKYKVSKQAKGKTPGQATVIGINGKKASKAKIPATAKAKETGETFQVVSIAAKAFAGNKSLTAVTIGNSVKTIGKNAFQGCPKLKSVTIGTGAQSISDGAFSKCPKLGKLAIKSQKLKKVGKGAVTGIYKKAVFKVSAKKLKAYKKLFTKKTGIKPTMAVKK